MRLVTVVLRRPIASCQDLGLSPIGLTSVGETGCHVPCYHTW